MGILRSYANTNFVTTLRAIAATMVVVIHTGAFSAFGVVGNNITEAGCHGVEIFFVISGFSIATTWAKAANYGDFLIRRIFRILPLYWVVVTLVFFLTRDGWLPHNDWIKYFRSDLSVYNYLMHVSGLSCFDHSIANTILGVEWTIPIELFWYAALPAVLAYTDSKKRFLVAFFCAIAGVAVTKGLAYLLIENSPGLFAKWFPTSHGPYFLVGVIAYRWRQAPPVWMQKHADRIVVGSLVSFIVFTLAGLPGQNVVASVSTCFVISMFNNDRFPAISKVVQFKPLLFIGTISYSMYLLHFPIALYLIKRFELNHGLPLFTATFGITIAASTVSFLLVENPTNALGKRLADTINKKPRLP